jgi:hypothetical protein
MFASSPPRDARRPPDERSRSALARALFYWFALLFVFAYAQLETHRALAFFTPLRQPALTLLWVGMAGYFLHRYRREGKGYLLPLLPLPRCGRGQNHRHGFPRLAPRLPLAV